MTNQHLISPPPEMVEKWVRMLEYLPDKQVFSEAARWGADQELESCIELLKADGYKALARDLCAARRPKPPSLKEQALEALDRMDQFPNIEDRLIVRRALEQLDD
jgi:hypothetical protein